MAQPRPRFIDYIVPFSKSLDPILFHLFNVCQQLCYNHFRESVEPNYNLLKSNDEVPEGFTALTVSGGISNRLAVIRWTKYPRQPLLIRLFLQHSSEVINRDSELRIAVAVSNECVGPSILGCFQNGRIEGFIEIEEELRVPGQVNGAPPLTPDLMLERGYSDSIAIELGKLHSSSLTWQEAANSALSPLQQFEEQEDIGDNNSNETALPEIDLPLPTPQLPTSNSSLSATGTFKDGQVDTLPKPVLWPSIQKWIGLARERYDKFNDTAQRQELYQSLQLPRIAREQAELKTVLNALEDTVVFTHGDLLSGNILRLPKGFTWAEYRTRYGLPFQSHHDSTLKSHLPPPVETALSPSHAVRPPSVASLEQELDDIVYPLIPRDNVAEEELPTSVLLIDFEYAGLNYASYDIGNHFAECCGFNCDWSKFPTKDNQTRFISKYLQSNYHILTDTDPYLHSPIFTARVEILRRRAVAFTLASHLYWGVWAVVMAANKPDIDFDYLSYAQKRFQGYWYMKSSCLLEILPLVWSKLHQTRWSYQLNHLLASPSRSQSAIPGISTSVQETSTIESQQPFDYTTAGNLNTASPSTMILGSGMSFVLALGVIGAAHGMAIYHLVSRLHPGETQEEWASRTAEFKDKISAMNNYYGNELGMHVDIAHLHLHRRDESSSDGQLCHCSCPDYHITKALIPIYHPTDSTSYHRNSALLSVYETAINEFIQVVTIHGLDSNGQLCLPSEFFLQRDQSSSPTTLSSSHNYNPITVVNPVTNITAIYKHFLATLLGLPPPTDSNEIDPNLLLSQPNASLIYQPYEPFTYQQAAHNIEIELAITSTPAYQAAIKTLLFGSSTSSTKYPFQQITPMVWQSQEDCYNFYNTPANAESTTAPSPSTVFIATPPQLHFEQAKVALNHNRHVIVDKPFTPDFNQTKELFHIAKERNLLISAYQNRRYDSDFLTAKYIARNNLGDNVNWFELSFQKGLSTKDWKMESIEKGGGRLWDLGAHSIDQCIQLQNGAKPVKVYANIRFDIDGYSDIDSHAFVEITFSNGKTGLIDVGSFVMLEKPRYVIVGDVGTMLYPPTNHGATTMDPQEDMLLALLPVNCTTEASCAEVRLRPMNHQPAYYKARLAQLQAAQRLKSHQDLVANKQPVLYSLTPLFTTRWSRFFEHFQSYMQFYTLATHQTQRLSNNSSLNANISPNPHHHYQFGGRICVPHAPSIILNAHFQKITQSAALDDVYNPVSIQHSKPLVLKKLSLPVRDTPQLAALFRAILRSAKSKQVEPVTFD